MISVGAFICAQRRFAMVTRSASPSEGKRKLALYEKLERLGEGGFGEASLVRRKDSTKRKIYVMKVNTFTISCSLFLESFSSIIFGIEHLSVYCWFVLYCSIDWNIDQEVKCSDQDEVIEALREVTSNNVVNS